jgi:hypothetical protein
MNARSRSSVVDVGATLSLLLAVVLWPRTALGYRPFDSTDASVASPGELEIELGPVGFLDDGRRRFLVAPDLVVNLGLTRGWELVAQGRHLRLLCGAPGEPGSRLAGTGLFLKGVLRTGSLQDKPGPSIATELGLLLPTVNDVPGAGISATGILSQRWRFVTMHLDVAVSMTRAQDLDLFGGVILEGPHAWPARPVVEVFVERELHAALSISGLAGAIWRVRESLSLDAGLRLSRIDAARALEARAGLTWAFPLWG